MSTTAYRLGLAAACLIIMSATVFAEEERSCYPLATLKVSFRVVFPKAKQVTMVGDEARAYLAAYNEYGKPTNFTGDSLLFSVMPDGTALFVPFVGNRGCKRIVVGPMLHRRIMLKVKRGRT